MMINPNDSNVAMLDRVAQLLGPDICDTIAFVGGAAAGLLITDLAMPAIRRTDDVEQLRFQFLLGFYTLPHLLSTLWRFLRLVLLIHLSN